MQYIFTDGSSLGNPGPGGWAAIGIIGEKEVFRVSGGEGPTTTNNRMELKAIIEGVIRAKENGFSNFTIYTDSKYVKDGITKWVLNWQKNDWKTSSGQPVKNIELWKKLLKNFDSGITIEWVKAHNGNPNNEKVDKLANACARLNKLENSNDCISTG